MSTPNGHNLTRTHRVTMFFGHQGPFARFWHVARTRIHITFVLLVTIFLICWVVRAWEPPFTFRPHSVLDRDLVCRTPFRVFNPEKTKEAKERAIWDVPHVFQKDSRSLIQLRDSIPNVVSELIRTGSYDALDEKNKGLWNDFCAKEHVRSRGEDLTPGKAFEEFLAEIKDDPDLNKFKESLAQAFKPMEDNGILMNLGFGASEGNQDIIRVYPYTEAGSANPQLTDVSVSETLIGDGSRLRFSLNRAFWNGITVQFLNYYIHPRLQETLTPDAKLTTEAVLAAVDAIEDQYTDYLPGQVMIKSGHHILSPDIGMLLEEHKEILKHRTKTEMVVRFLGFYLFVLLIFILSWGFIYRRERRRPKSLLQIYSFAGSILATIILSRICQWASFGMGNAELIPILLFAQCIAITFSWELSLVMSLELAVIAALSGNSGISSMTIFFLTTAAVVLQLGRLRTRNKLVVVGFFGGLFVFFVTFVVGILEGSPISLYLIGGAGLNFFWTLSAGVIMTGLLPFIERPFGILTDMSLLELGDASHPLLVELSRRAPATHNHSFQVGNIAEAACEAVGARGLMTRIGARFHDIGKIFKPQFFSENQAGGENIHDTLEPRMSTLVIVSHVKDGVDLAEQYRLPKPLVDLIKQHHGTSLVTYFYGRANRLSKESPYGQPVDESTFRYPGPKPQTKEAAILMLADAVESACRSLGDAPRGRIENMVRQITKAKLEDGQFDESHLTLGDLRKIENSIINSMIVIRHNRIKYPGQEGSSEPAIGEPKEPDTAIINDARR